MFGHDISKKVRNDCTDDILETGDLYQRVRLHVNVSDIKSIKIKDKIHARRCVLL